MINIFHFIDTYIRNIQILICITNTGNYIFYVHETWKAF